MNVAIVSFDFGLGSFSLAEFIIDWFDFEQSDDYMKAVGLESGSSFVNLIGMLTMLVFGFITTMVLYILKTFVLKSSSNGWFAKVFHAVYKFMAYTFFVLVIMEGLTITCLSVFTNLSESEMYSVNHKLRTLVFALIV